MSQRYEKKYLINVKTVFFRLLFRIFVPVNQKNTSLMKRFLPLFCALCLALGAAAETTYLPTYRGYIHIIDGTDTVAVESPLAELALSDTASSFTIHINHELVDEDKVEAIKRSKRTQLVMTVTSVVSGVPGGGVFTQLGQLM
jgi:hypothetical protein